MEELFDEDTTMQKLFDTLLREQGSFVTVLGQGTPGSVRTIPTQVEPTKLGGKTEDRFGSLIECYGYWTGLRRIQFQGPTLAAALQLAVVACNKVPMKQKPDPPVDKVPNLGAEFPGGDDPAPSLASPPLHPGPEIRGGDNG